jgi:hypothetical protein
MTPDAEFREAVTRLHRAKDAAYRDAWKRRGEVIFIIANIARDGPAGFEALLSRADLGPFTIAGLPVTEAAGARPTCPPAGTHRRRYRTRGPGSGASTRRSTPDSCVMPGDGKRRRD